MYTILIYWVDNGAQKLMLNPMSMFICMHVCTYICMHMWLAGQGPHKPVAVWMQTCSHVPIQQHWKPFGLTGPYEIAWAHLVFNTVTQNVTWCGLVISQWSGNFSYPHGEKWEDRVWGQLCAGAAPQRVHSLGENLLYSGWGKISSTPRPASGSVLQSIIF